MNRRAFLRGTAMTAVGIMAASCAQPTAQVIEREVPVEKIVKETVVVEKQVAVEKVVKETVVVQKEVAVEKVVTATPIPAKFKEAPMLAELVKAGKLPPVDERLPKNPLVVPVLEAVGKYGGTIRRGFSGTSDGPGPTKLNGQGWIWFDTLTLAMRPNMAEGWEINGDASVWTWKLREGIKWSDGKPMTSADTRWWYDNVVLNETLTGAPPTAYSTGSPKVLMDIELPDDFTVVLKFAHPNPLYVVEERDGMPAVPGHYVSKFHIDTTPDKAALEKQVADAGFETWNQLYSQMANWQMNPDMPFYGPWLPTSTMADELFVMERNPYYFGIDEEGQQLPYVDKVIHRLFSTSDVFNMWILNGEIDFQNRHVSASNFTLFKEGEAQGDYRVMTLENGNVTSINANLTSKNPNIREFLQNRDVRFALNHAVDRYEINELIYDGLATPMQCSPMIQSPQHYPEQAFANMEHDIDKANALLDKAGYTQRDSDGYRLWKDGSGRCGFVIEYIGDADNDVVTLYVKYLADVGVFCTPKLEQRSLYTERFQANEVDASVAFGFGRTLMPILAPQIVLGTAIDHPWACAWGMWKNNPSDANAEEPPDGHWIKQMWDIYDQVAMEASEAKRNELFRGILDIWKDEMPMAGYCSQFVRPCIVKNGLHNYVDGLPEDNTTFGTGLANPHTLFWDDPENHM